MKKRIKLVKLSKKTSSSLLMSKKLRLLSYCNFSLKKFNSFNIPEVDCGW